MTQTSPTCDPTPIFEPNFDTNQNSNVVDYDFEEKLNIALTEVQLKIEQLSVCMHPLTIDLHQCKVLLGEIQNSLSHLIDLETIRDALWLSSTWRKNFDFAEAHPEIFEPILPIFWHLQPTLQLEDLCASGYHPTAACNFSEALAIEQLKIIFERSFAFSSSALSMGTLCSILSQRPNQMLCFLNQIDKLQYNLDKGEFLVFSTNPLPPIVTDVDCFIRHPNIFDIPLAIVKLNSEQKLDLFTISLLAASTQCAKILKERFHSYPTKEQIITLLSVLLANTQWNDKTREDFKQKVLNCYQNVFA